MILNKKSYELNTRIMVNNKSYKLNTTTTPNTKSCKLNATIMPNDNEKETMTQAFSCEDGSKRFKVQGSF